MVTWRLAKYSKKGKEGTELQPRDLPPLLANGAIFLVF